MPILNPNSTNYQHPWEPNLADLHTAMDYNADNEPAVRVITTWDGNIVIEGDVNIPGTVTVNSTPQDPVHNHITEVGTSGILDVPYMPIGGTVDAHILGQVPIYTESSTTLGISGTVFAEQTGTWTVGLNQTALDALENVGVTGTVTIQDGGNTITVDGTVTANVTFPTTQQVSGTVALDTATLTALENTTVTVTGSVVVDNDSSNPLEVNAQITNVDPINVNATISDGGGSITVDGTVNAVFTGTVTTTVVDGQQDAFGRLRVSEAFTLGDYKHTYGIDPNFRDTLTNGGTVTHIANQACARLATTSNTSSRAIHQTKMYHNYMPGKSQLIKTTINFYAHTANVTKRTGYFDNLNGIYFEQDGAGVLSFVIRTNTSGTASDDRRITQANWNTDKCNGTGVSGFNLDITKTQIVFIDFQWLGVGRVRCGFVHDGQMIIAHEFYNSNNLPVVYMANPNLPIRCEILNTGATAGGYFDQICSTVVSEGGYMESGIDFSVDTGQTSQSITTANGMYPVVAIRLKNSFRGYPNRVVVRSGNINVYAEEYPAYWALYKLSDLSAITLSNPTWTSANDDSAIEYTLLATAFTGGDRIDGGIVGTTSPGGSAKGTGTAPVNQPSNAKKNFIAQNLDSTDSEIYVVCGKAIGGTTKLWVDFQWREIY